uniref:PDZ domain-containing protein n=1 Tax=Haptolina ericina TaxID=156174 RepID=A0A7S3FJB7_9EUKA
MTDLTVLVRKDTVDTKIGLRLEDRKADGLPKIVQITPGGAAMASGQLKKGDVLVSINGMDVRGHKRAAEVLKEAQGDIKMVIRRGGKGIFRKQRSKMPPASEMPAGEPEPMETTPSESTVQEDEPEAAFDVDSQQMEALVKIQSTIRGQQVRKQMSGDTTNEVVAEEPVPEAAAEPVAEAAPVKKEGFKFGFFGKKTEEEVAWDDTYTVTLTRGADTMKEGKLVKASLGMKIVQFQEDAPPVISEIYEGQPAAATGIMRKGDTILTVNGIDMSDPTKGIGALAEASEVTITGQRGSEEIAQAAAKLQATFRGNKTRKGGEPAKPAGWFSCCASPRKPKKMNL